MRESFGPFVQAAMCGECLDGFALHWGLWVASQPAPATGRCNALVCRACGATKWKQAVGRKVIRFKPALLIFETRVGTRWEWRTEDIP